MFFAGRLFKTYERKLTAKLLPFLPSFNYISLHTNLHALIDTDGYKIIFLEFFGTIPYRSVRYRNIFFLFLTKITVPVQVPEDIFL